MVIKRLSFDSFCVTNLFVFVPVTKKKIMQEFLQKRWSFTIFLVLSFSLRNSFLKKSFHKIWTTILNRRINFIYVIQWVISLSIKFVQKRNVKLKTIKYCLHDWDSEAVFYFYKNCIVRQLLDLRFMFFFKSFFCRSKNLVLDVRTFKGYYNNYPIPFSWLNHDSKV